MKKENYHKYARHKNKLGQIEVFGLAFIVILISIGFFIFVSFKAQQKVENPQKEFTNDKLANDFVLSMKYVSVQGCTEYSVEELIIDCARDNRIKCATEDSCIAVNRSINIMLNKTFMVTNTKFRFWSENLKDASGKDLLNVTYLNCNSTSRQGQRGFAIIPLYPTAQDVYLNINICY
jgi:hypothetical protein